MSKLWTAIKKSGPYTPTAFQCDFVPLIFPNYKILLETLYLSFANKDK